MLLILGGAHSGRHAFFNTLGVAEADCATVTAFDAHAFAAEGTTPQLSTVCARLSTYRVVIATERGLGIIPLDACDRTAREENGRLNIALASLADCVVLVVAGIPRVIKGALAASLSARPVYLAVFRHGATEANLARRYAGGGTDVPLCSEGRKQVQAAREAFAAFAARCAPSVRAALLSPALVYVSPLQRCTETAALLFPASEQRAVADFRELDFGAFENKTADELLASPETRDAYTAFIDCAAHAGANGTVRCPPRATGAGESVAQFVARTTRAFSDLMRASSEATTAAVASAGASPRVIIVVAHGGTQMALFNRFFALPPAATVSEIVPLPSQSAATASSYYAWQSDCAGFRFGRVAL